MASLPFRSCIDTHNCDCNHNKQTNKTNSQMKLCNACGTLYPVWQFESSAHASALTAVTQHVHMDRSRGLHM